MKSNISKQFAAKAKRGLRFADGLVQDQMVTGTPSNAPWMPNADQSAMLASYDARAKAAHAFETAPTAPTVSASLNGDPQGYQSTMNQLGTVNPTPGLGQGAQHNFFNKSMSELQGGNQPYMPGSANDPHASASIGPKGPISLAQASPGRRPLRQWQEPAFADGVVPETADQLMARMTAKYGAPSAGAKAPEPAPVSAPQPVQQAPQPKPQPGGLFGQALRGLRGANDELRKAANYKDGMVHEGPGIVHGPGGPREDKVDAKLSDGEAVLPAATVAALGGPEEVAELIQRTNGKEPTIGMRDGAHANMGGFVDDFGNLNEPTKFQGGSNRVTLHQQIAAADPAAQVAPTGQTVRSGFTQPAAPAAVAQPLPQAEQFGRNAAKVYQDVGGARGLAGKALNAIVPAAAAIDTMGADGIRVEGNREGDPTNDSASGIERVVNAAKEIGLRAGDWGTKGADMLMDLPLWALNKAGATSEGRPLEYGLINKNYRQGMRDANLAGVTIPQSATEREMIDAQGESKAMHKKYANKDGNMGTVVDQSAIDALKAANADKAKVVTLAAATKAGNIPGHNHVPEAVTMQDQAASAMMGKEVDKLTGVSSYGDGGLRGMAQRLNSYATDESARKGRNAELQLRGDGARYEKGADGKLTLTNSGDFDGSTKMQYTGADGKPTAVFAGSAENQRGLADAKGLRRQLANFEQMNLERNAKEDITDAGLRNYSRGVLKDQATQSAKLNETLLSKQPSQLDIEKFKLDKDKFQHELQKTTNLQENNIRDYKAARSDKVNARVDKLLDTMAPTAGLKDDALTAAHSRRADLQEALYSTFGKNMPEDDAALNESLPQLMVQAKTSLAIRDAIKNRSLWNKIGNIGSDPWTTLHAAKLSEDGKNIRFPNNFTIPIEDVVKDGNAKSADILAALQSRTK